MFDAILDLASDHFGDSFFQGPRRREAPSDQEWENASRSLVHRLAESVKTLQAAACVTLTPTLLDHSKSLLLWYRHRGPVICTVQTRPENTYYERTAKPIPVPENPDGPHATGVELSVDLAADYGAPSNGREYRITLRFQVWGTKERDAFRELYLDYRRIVQRLVKAADAEFFSSRSTLRLEAYRGRKATTLLDLYLAEEDEEDSFDLSLTVSRDANPSTVVKAYTIFAALYDACYHYSAFRGGKGRDRILHHAFQLLEGR